MTDTAADAVPTYVVTWEPTDGFRLPRLYLTGIPEKTMRDPVSLLDPIQISTPEEHKAMFFSNRELAEKARGFFEWWYFERGFHIPASGTRGALPSRIVVEVLESECV